MRGLLIQIFQLVTYCTFMVKKLPIGNFYIQDSALTKLFRGATATEAVARQRPAHGHTTSARPGHTATQVPIGALAGAWMAGMTMPARQPSRAPQLGVDTSAPMSLYSLEVTAVRAQSRTCDQPIVTSAATARLSRASWRNLE